MNQRTLKIALAASLALNLFAGAAGITAYLNRSAVEERVGGGARDRVRIPAMEVIETLEEPQRERVRAMLREAALAARPDFREARQARREAIALTESEAFDAAAVRSLLEQSRASELRGRARLEGDAVRVLSELDDEDRARMAVVLERHGPRLHQRNPDRAQSSQPEAREAAGS